jgi:hypothetical protein
VSLGLGDREKQNQKNDPTSTERMLIQAQTINPTTTTMGKP